MQANLFAAFDAEKVMFYQFLLICRCKKLCAPYFPGVFLVQKTTNLFYEKQRQNVVPGRLRSLLPATAWQLQNRLPIHAGTHPPT